MTTLVTADLHLNDKARDSYRHKFMAETLPALVHDHRAELVLILGDLTEEKDRHGAWLTNMVAAHIDLLAGEADVVISRGNHDYVDAATPFYEWLGRISGVTWINQPTVFEHKALPGGRALFLPHTNNWEQDWLGHSTVTQTGIKHKDPIHGTNDMLVFAHNTFEGAITEHGKKLKGIPLTAFPAGTRVISGDIHTPQSLGDEDVLVSYVGAPYTVNFGDDYKPRVLIVDKKITSVPVPGPQKRLLNMTLDAAPTDRKPDAIISDILSLEGLAALPGDIVKIRVKMEPGHVQHWPQVKQHIRAWAEAEELVLHQMQPVVDRTTRLSSKQQVKVRTDEQMLKDYTTARGVDELHTKAGFRLMRTA